MVTISASKSVLKKRVLPVGEWFAENAYIAPGMNRLMTATGLMTGLMAGRYMMDILVGTDKNGNKTDRSSVPQPLQGFHAVLEYNKFDDTAYAKWHKVFDHTAPIILGALGAMAGSSYFFTNRHRIAPKLIKELQEGGRSFYLQHASYTAEIVQSKYYNRAGGAAYGLSAKAGMHLWGPLSPTLNAIRFQLGAGKKSMFPGLHKLTGNRGANSTNLYNSLLDMIEWTEHNTAHYAGTEWAKANGDITKKARNALQSFKNATPEDIKIFERYIEHTIKTLEPIAKQIKAEHGDLVGDALVKEFRKDNRFYDTVRDAFWRKGLEDQYINMGLLDPKNPSNSQILYGDNGILTDFGKMLGGRKHLSDIQTYFEKTVQIRQGHLSKNTSIISNNKPKDLNLFNENSLYKGMGLATGILGITATIGARATEKDLSEREKTLLRKDVPRHEAAHHYHRLKDQRKDSSVLDVINGKPLEALNWLSNMFVVPPSLHRFMNAASLSVFLYGGMKLSNTLAGRGLKGDAIAKADIWRPLQPLYKKMDYAWKSSNTQDRWRAVAHQLIPVSVGAVGTYTGSRLFFKDRIDKANHAEYLEEYTDKVSMDESETYAKASGVTSILNTGSGSHLLPFISYSSNLQNRFLMGNGLQVATPGIGKWWSGNPSKYPWHINRLLDHIIQYATENSSEYPKEFDALAHAFVAKLYPDMPLRERQTAEDAFIDELYAVRDRFWQEGGVKEERKSECTYELEQHFKREGLERTMLKIGLDPRNANIDHNGAGAAMAKWMGAGGRIEKDKQEYQSKVSERMKRYQQTPPPQQGKPDTTIKKPSDQIAVSSRLQNHKETHIKH